MKYSELKIGKNKDGKDVYKVALPSTIKTYTNDLYIVSVEGDKFHSLAYRYYGDESLWWVIANANGLAKGNMVIKPGTALVIPSEI